MTSSAITGLAAESAREMAREGGGDGAMRQAESRKAEEYVEQNADSVLIGGSARTAQRRRARVCGLVHLQATPHPWPHLLVGDHGRYRGVPR